MSSYRVRSRLDALALPIVSNNANFSKTSAHGPVLISWDDARTLFHEFGHALHGLTSAVTYPALAGTRVPIDYLEFPSQLLERWLETPELLQRFAQHVKTGEAMPDELIRRITASRRHNKGFAATEYLAAAVVDLKLHLAGARVLDPNAFERETLSQMHMPREIVMRHRIPQFAHVFGSEAYSAAYYSYLWAETFAADAVEAFEQAPAGFYDQQMARALHDCVLSVGNAVDPVEGFRRFRGRDVDTSALMRQRGFAMQQ